MSESNGFNKGTSPCRTDPARTVERVAEAKLPTHFGDFTIVGFRSLTSDEEFVVLTKGKMEREVPTLVRIHSQCLTGDVFGSIKCDCGPQLQKAIEMIQAEGRGAIVYQQQEGRGIGIINKIRAYALQDDGADTVEANEKLGFAVDARTYQQCAEILFELGLCKVRVMTNNPEKIAALKEAGLKVVERIPIEIETEEPAAHYLKTKKRKTRPLAGNVMDRSERRMKMRTRKIFNVAFAITILVFAGTVSIFAQGRSSVSGFVFDANRRPLQNVIVELLTDFNSTVGRARTDGSGRYYIGGLGQGRFTVIVKPFGTAYDEQSADIEIAGIGVRGQPLADSVQQDFYLKLDKRSRSTPFINDVVYAQDVPAEAEGLYKRALSDLGTDRVEDGIDGLTRALEIFPEYFIALQKLGATYLSQDKFAEAAAVFARAVAVNDRSFDSHYGLAYANFGLKRFPEAMVPGEKAVELKSDSFEATLLLGLIQRNAKSYDKAEKSLLNAIKLSEERSPDAYWNLALLYAHNLNRYADAAKQLELFLKVSPDAPNKEEVKKVIKHYKDKAKAGS